MGTGEIDLFVCVIIILQKYLSAEVGCMYSTPSQAIKDYLCTSWRPNLIYSINCTFISVCNKTCMQVINQRIKRLKISNCFDFKLWPWASIRANVDLSVGRAVHGKFAESKNRNSLIIFDYLINFWHCWSDRVTTKINGRNQRIKRIKPFDCFD